ncbi:hypothetical protein M426DRAFT_22048 [Hypoxylon sp. CI-4A]|nr:hypothetical protein M426DRAFT_22048 [Hypoxylon sp. CI-4A]
MAELHHRDGSQAEERGNAKTALLDCINATNTSGRIATFNSHIFHTAGDLSAHGVMISLPLKPFDIFSVMKAAGRINTQTYLRLCSIVGGGRPSKQNEQELVRNTLHSSMVIERRSLTLDNILWEKQLENFLAGAARELGPLGLRSELDRLCLDLGDLHFTQNNVPGKVATLVVFLPSVREGGSVHISYGNRREVLSTNELPSRIKSLMWPIDVTCEIKSVESGCRGMLVYNLFPHDHGTAPSAGSIIKQSTALHTALSNWKAKVPDGKYLVHKIAGDDDYGLRYNLITAAKKSGFAIFFATMNRELPLPNAMGPKHLWLSSMTTHYGTLISNEEDIDKEQLALGIGPHEDLWAREPNCVVDGSLSNCRVRARYSKGRHFHDQVIIMVPMRHLKDFINNPIGPSVAAYVTRLLADHQTDPFVLASAVQVLNNAIGRDMNVPQTLNTHTQGGEVPMALYGLNNTLKDLSGHKKKLSEQPWGSVVLENAILSLTRDVEKTLKLLKRAFPGHVHALDFDYWVGHAILRAPGSSLSAFNDILKHLDATLQGDEWDEIRQLYASWKILAMQKIAQQQQELHDNDSNTVLGLIESQGHSPQIMEGIAQILSRRADKSLICLILQGICHKDEAQWKVRAFQVLLKVTVGKLDIKVLDFPNDDSLGAAEMYKDMYPIHALRVIHVAQRLGLGLSDEVLKLLTMSCNNISHLNPGSEDHFAAPLGLLFFLNYATEVLKTMSPSYDAVSRDLYTDILLKEMCSPSCQSCKMFKDFHYSPEKSSAQFSGGWDRRRHLEQRIPSTHYAFFPEETAWYDEFTIKKVEKSTPLEWYTSALKDPWVKSLLGDDLFNELVLRKEVSDSQGADKEEATEANVAKLASVALAALRPTKTMQNEASEVNETAEAIETAKPTESKDNKRKRGDEEDLEEDRAAKSRKI